MNRYTTAQLSVASSGGKKKGEPFGPPCPSLDSELGATFGCVTLFLLLDVAKALGGAGGRADVLALLENLLFGRANFGNTAQIG